MDIAGSVQKVEANIGLDEAVSAVRPPIPSWYLWSSAVLLVMVAGLKFAVMAAGSRRLALSDSIFGLRYSILVPLSAAVELFIALLLFSRSTRAFGLMLLTLFAANLVLYSILLAAVGGTALPCPCLGALVDWWPGLEKWQFPFLTAVALYWLLGGLQFLFPKSRIATK